MTKIAAALALVAALAGLAAGETYALKPTDGDAPGYKLSSDRAPVMTPQGVPAFPPGTRLTIEAEGVSRFEVFMIGPASLDEDCARRRWSGTVESLGGYKLQFGRERSPYMSQLDFIVSPDVQRLAQTTPYDYGWEER